MGTEKNLCIVTGNLIVAKEVFVDGGAEKLLEPLRKKLKEFIPDTTTAKGRKEIASFAAKFSKSKTLVDGIGKELKDEYSVIIKPIDKERKIFRDGCDEMKIEARKALTTWEAEQERIVEEERQKVAFELDYEEALGIDDLFNREREMAKKEADMQKRENDRIAKEEAEKAETDRLKNEARIKKEAEKKATKDAEAKIEREKKESSEKIRNARTQRIYNLGFTLIENIFVLRSSFGDIEINNEHISVNDEAFESLINRITKRLEEDRIETEKIKAKKEQDDALEKQRKEQEEKDRLQKLEEKRKQDEKDRLAANKNHQRAINRKVVEKLMSIIYSENGVDVHIIEDQAIQIVTELVKNPIKEISVNYGR